MFLVFKPPKPVDVLLFGLVFTDDVDGVFFLVEGVDLVLHKVGNVFFIEFDGVDGAVFLLNTEKGFFHAEGSDSASETPDFFSLCPGCWDGEGGKGRIVERQKVKR